MRELTHLREARLTQAPCVHDRRPDSGMDGTLVVRTGEAWFYLHFEEVNRLSGFFSKTISHFSTFDSQWTVPSPAHALCSRKEEELLASPRAQLEVTQDLGALCSVEEKTAILVLKDISSMTK